MEPPDYSGIFDIATILEQNMTLKQSYRFRQRYHTASTRKGDFESMSLKTDVLSDCDDHPPRATWFQPIGIVIPSPKQVSVSPQNGHRFILKHMI